MHHRRLLVVSATLLGCSADDVEPFVFPTGFEWGTATAAYQIEGGPQGGGNTTSNWWQWEQRCVVGSTPGTRDPGETVTDCESNVDGPDGWSQFASDFAAAREMGHGAVRLGIEWAKLEPSSGAYDLAAFAHYQTVLDEARAAALAPMVTLQHYTLPIWVQDNENTGSLEGWAGAQGSRAGEAPIIAAFARYCGDVGEALGASVDTWVTVNEPIISLLTGYLTGAYPPGRIAEVGTTIRALFNMAYAHAACYDALHARDLIDADGDGVAANVSVAQHWRIMDPADPNKPGSVASAARGDFLLNRLFLDTVTAGKRDLNADGDTDDADETIDPALVDRLDWLGINYYGRELFLDSLGTLDGIEVPLGYQQDANPALPRSDLGWEIYPEGLGRVLGEAKSYGLPIRITENGVADAEGSQRAAFIVSHLHVLGEAMRAGADVRGYYHWSLIDNFEWNEGFGPRFGLLRVDYTDPSRARSKSRGAEAYSAIIGARSVTTEIRATYGEIVRPTK